MVSCFYLKCEVSDSVPLHSLKDKERVTLRSVFNSTNLKLHFFSHLDSIRGLLVAKYCTTQKTTFTISDTYVFLHKVCLVFLDKQSCTSRPRTNRQRPYQNLQRAAVIEIDMLHIIHDNILTETDRVNLPAPNKSLTMLTIFSSDIWMFEFSSNFRSSQ